MINSKTISYPFSNADLLCLTEYSGIYPLYIGCAAPGSAVSAADWQIKKLTHDENNNVTHVQFADGVNDYNKVWNNEKGPGKLFALRGSSGRWFWGDRNSCF